MLNRIVTTKDLMELMDIYPIARKVKNPHCPQSGTVRIFYNGTLCEDNIDILKMYIPIHVCLDLIKVEEFLN